MTLFSNARKGRANVMAMSWHTMPEFEPPRVDACYANRECRVVDTRFVAKYCFFVVKAHGIA